MDTQTGYMIRSGTNPWSFNINRRPRTLTAALRGLKIAQDRLNFPYACIVRVDVPSDCILKN